MAGRHSKHMPKLANINGELHKLTGFLITTRVDGLPSECRLVRDTESVEVRQGMEFMTAYIPKVMYKKGANRETP